MGDGRGRFCVVSYLPERAECQIELMDKEISFIPITLRTMGRCLDDGGVKMEKDCSRTTEWCGQTSFSGRTVQYLTAYASHTAGWIIWFQLAEGRPTVTHPPERTLTGVGSHDWLTQLSLNRAKAATIYLVARGIGSLHGWSRRAAGLMRPICNDYCHRQGVHFKTMHQKFSSSANNHQQKQ